MSSDALSKDERFYHATSPVEDRTLCGDVMEGDEAVGIPRPRFASAGHLVTCDTCRRIIAHCQDSYTVNFRRRHG